MRLIDADALIAEYDRVHVGAPGGARKLMQDAPTIEPSSQPEYEELTPEEAASEIASETLMSVWYWLDDLTRLKQMGYAICRKR